MSKCVKHPKYKGKIKPRVSCEACWAFYLGMAEACVNCGCELQAAMIIDGLSGLDQVE